MNEYVELNSIEGKMVVNMNQVKYIKDSRVGAYIYFIDGTNMKVNGSYEEIKAILSGKPLPELPRI